MFANVGRERVEDKLGVILLVNTGKAGAGGMSVRSGTLSVFLFFEEGEDNLDKGPHVWISHQMKRDRLCWIRFDLSVRFLKGIKMKLL